MAARILPPFILSLPFPSCLLVRCCSALSRRATDGGTDDDDDDVDINDDGGRNGLSLARPCRNPCPGLHPASYGRVGKMRKAERKKKKDSLTTRNPSRGISSLPVRSGPSFTLCPEDESEDRTGHESNRETERGKNSSNRQLHLGRSVRN